MVIKRNKQDEELYCKIKQRQEKIRQIAESVDIVSSLGILKTNSDEWTDIYKTNVKQRLCSLDAFSDDVTCCSVKFEKEGYVEPHTHDREETIFCADGQYYDPVNKVILRPGDSMTIEPNQLHAGKSDYCLLFITWRPKFHNSDEEVS